MSYRTTPAFAGKPPKTYQPLCEDEGCPMHGIPHICYTVQLPAPILHIPDDRVIN